MNWALSEGVDMMKAMDRVQWGVKSVLRRWAGKGCTGRH